MLIDLDSVTPSQAYFLMGQTLVPRPIAWVLSENANHSYNLAPFSYFSTICSDPPILMLSVGKRADGSPKDTSTNIRERDHFVVHIAHGGQLDPLNASAASLPSGQSEVHELGLTTTTFGQFPLPRLADARVAYACERYRIDHIGNQDQTLIFGQIRAMYLDDHIIEKHDNGRLKVNHDKLDPLARLGANEYLSAGHVVKMDRPS